MATHFAIICQCDLGTVIADCPTEADANAVRDKLSWPPRPQGHTLIWVAMNRIHPSLLKAPDCSIRKEAV